MCVCTWPTVLEVCPNYEAMVFQPWTVNPLHRGSVAIVTLKLALLPHLFLPFVWIFLLPPTSYRPTIHGRSLLKSSLIFTRSPSTILDQRSTHIYIDRTFHIPAYSSHLCALYRMHAYAVVPVTVGPSICRPWPMPRSMSASGGFVCHIPLCLCCDPASPSPSSPPNPGIVRSMVSCCVTFSERARGQYDSTT